MPTAAPTPSHAAESPVFRAGDLVAVLLPLPLAGPYDYRVPDGVELRPGDVVEAPLGRRQERGVVWGPGTGTVEPKKLRSLIARLGDAPPLPEASRRFVDWVAAYTLSAPGAVLRMALSVPDALEPVRAAVAYRRTGADPEALGLRLTEARRRVLEVCAGQPPLAAAEIARAAATSSGVVKGLADAGLLESVLIDPLEAEPRPDGAHPGPTLSPDQTAAAGRLVAALGQGFSVTLLEGVTGSGKTEVYFEAVAAALRAGRQVLVLVPEITLTAQWLDRFAARFGAPPHAWHSELPQGRRRRTWRAVAEGRAAVVVGARSALFLPYADLGLIIVDEEHEQAFKQEEGVVYHARDMAVVRGQVGGVPVVLASATPSLETVQNAQAGRYERVHLPSRHAGAALPDVRVVDMRKTPPDKEAWGRSWLAPPLVTAIGETLAAGEQVMLFLNRRGYAPLTLCRACGHRLQCPHCTAWLVEHKLWNRLQCHHCGHSTPIPRECPACGAEDKFAACGPGVERLAEEVAHRFPDVRAALVASDTLSGPGATAELVRRVADKEIDLLIGTQILAKGLHFPHLTLVGVVDADLGLSGGDLRAAERTFQLLSQVAGRAGRGERPGVVYLQTWQPGHPVLQAMVSGDADLFLETEAEGRRLLGMPPFGRLAALVVSGPEEAAVESTARALGRAAPRSDGIEVLGPAPAPLAVLRGRHRWRLLLKAPRAVKVQPVIRGWLTAVQWPSSVRVQVDIDPYGFL
ncbi:primosomal protein N' [Novispirillum sp. DQ9]|uniref:primosomal protein N' n=1 Tax=Novispirillum sp. DQ9 TaxID=3398612 RepID=UPI003C7E505B